MHSRAQLRAALAIALLVAVTVLIALSGCGGGKTLIERLPSFEPLGAKPPWGMFGKDETGRRRSEHKGPSKNTVRWSFKAYSDIHSAPVVGPDGTVFFESLYTEADGLARIYALDSDGTLKWTQRTTFTGYSTSSGASPLAVDSAGTLYSGHMKSLRAFNPDGNMLWETVFSDYVNDSSSQPAFGQDGRIYMITYWIDENPNSSGRALTVVNPDGTIAWTRSENFQTNILALAADGTIYAANGGQLIAINPDGTTKWFGPGSSGGFASLAVADDGTIFAIDGRYDNATLIAVNPTNGLSHGVFGFPPLDPGTYRWQSMGMAIGADGTIYCADAKVAFQSEETVYAAVYAVRPDGSLKYPPFVHRNYAVSGSAPAVDSNGIVYIGTKLGTMLAISPTGSLKWSASLGSYKTKWKGVQSSPAIGADGTVYICGGNSNTFYAIGPGTP